MAQYVTASVPNHRSPSKPLDPLTVEILGRGFQIVGSYLDKIPVVWDEVASTLRESKSQRFGVPPLHVGSWARFYERGSALGLISMLVGSGIGIAGDSLVEAVLDRSLLPRASPMRSPIDRLFLIHFAPSVLALKNTLAGWGSHHVLLSSLVAQVGRDGPEADEAFFDAVGIDPETLLTRNLSARLTRAVFEQDQDFLKRLGNVLRDPPKREHERDTARLQACFAWLSSFGFLDRVTTADMAYHLFVTLGRVYPGEIANISSKENLWRLVRNAQRKHRKKSRGENSS